MSAPSKIHIHAENRDLPEWVLERATSDLASDGSFEMEASDGPMKVERGFAVFAINDGVYGCLPKTMQAKLADVAGSTEAVAELETKTSAMKASKAANAAKSKAKAREKAATEGAPLRIKPMVGSPPTPAFCLVDSLQVDDSYQRSIQGGASKSLIRKIAENWDWRLCLPLIVSRRDGQYFVIDGQHRLEGARLRGDIRDIPVVIFDFTDPKQEAELFIQANRSRRAMGMLDDFHAAIVAGDEKAAAINDVVVGAGLEVGRNQAWQYWQPGEVVFIAAIKRALNRYGKEISTRSLATIARAFEGQILTGGGAIFGALCTLVAESEKAGSPIDLDLMQIVLSETGLTGWKDAVDGIEGGAERAEVMERAMRAAYAEAEQQ